MKAANQGIVWQWQCDHCYRYFGPKVVTESDLPSFEQMIADGWSIGKVHGDICPSCLADGVRPKSERHPVHSQLAAASTKPEEVGLVKPAEDVFGITHGITTEQAVGFMAAQFQTIAEAGPTIRRLEGVIEQKAIEEK